MDKRPLMGRGPVRGPPQGPREGHWRVLHVKFCHLKEIRTSTLPHETKRSSDALKHPRIRRAVSTLVYATLLHPAQGHLPMNLHPLKPRQFLAGELAGAAGSDMDESRLNREAVHLRS